MDPAYPGGPLASEAGVSVHYGVIAGVRHRIRGSEIRTELELRKIGSAAPSYSVSRGRRLVEFFTADGSVPARGFSGPSTPAAPSVSNLGALGAFRTAAVSWALPAGAGNEAYSGMEVHVSTTTGFTPSSSTLKAVSGGNTAVVLHGVAAGVTGYVRIIARDSLGNRSTPSPQTSFVS
jgi:hypothetical protein